MGVSPPYALKPPSEAAEPGLEPATTIAAASTAATTDLLLGDAAAAVRVRRGARPYAFVREVDELVDGPGRAPGSGGAARGAGPRRAAPEAGARRRPRGRPGDRGLVDAGRRHALPLGELAATSTRCGSTASRCGCRPGTSSSATCREAPAPSAASSRRCSASRPSARVVRPRWRSPSSSPTSSATCARTGIWTASTCPPRTSSASACPSSRSPGASPARLPAAARPRRCSGHATLFPEGARPPTWSRPACGRGMRWRGRLPAGARPHRAARLRRAAPARRPAAVGAGRARWRGACGARVTRRATLRGAERTPLDGHPADVLDLRRQLRGPGGGPRAGGRAAPTCCSSTATRSASGPPRPAPRRALARRDGRRGLDPAGDPLHELPHAARLGALPAAVELGRVRLPRAVPAAVRAVRRPLRDRHGLGPPRRRRGHRPRRAAARRWWSTRSGWRRVLAARRPPAARRPALARPRGASRRRRARPRRLDRALARALRLRLERAGGRRAARRRGLLRAA